MLQKKVQVSPNSYVFTFTLPPGPDGNPQPLNLSTCACILALPSGGSVKFDKKGQYSHYQAPICELDGNPYPPRPYTPISTNKLLGEFQLMIKIYPTGRFTQWLNLAVPGKTAVMFTHVQPNVKIQYPFGSQTKLGMLVGGTGKNYSPNHLNQALKVSPR